MKFGEDTQEVVLDLALKKTDMHAVSWNKVTVRIFAPKSQKPKATS